MRLSPLRALQSAAVIIAFLTPMSAHAQDITSSLIAHWKMDDTSGTSLTDSASTNTGTMNGGMNATTSTTAGQVGAALIFDGINDYISLTGGSKATSGYSAALWFKTTDSGTVFSFGSGDYFTAKVQVNGSVNFAFDNSGNPPGTPDTNITSPTGLNDGNWHHLVIVRDGARTGRIYIDGALSVADTDNSGSLSGIDNTPPIVIGRNTLTNSDYFNGTIDDVRTYNRAISAADAKALYEYAPGKIRYNEETEAVEYQDGTNWVHTGLGSYSPNGVEFDGTNDWLNVTQTFTNSKKFTASFWFKRNTTGTTQRIISSSGLELRFESTNGLRLTARNSSNSIIAYITSPTITDNDWHHISISFDLSNPARRHIYVDGISRLNGAPTYTNDLINFGGGTTYSIGGTNAGADLFNGDIADFWLETGTYIDLSVAANREKFISPNNMPMYMGPDGSLPLGKSPDTFLSGATDDWHTNKGTASGFSESGTLTDATTQPGEPDIDIDLASGLLGRWTMDEGAGTTVTNSVSGAGTGTLTNMDAGSDWVNGKIGGALDFDGSDDRVILADSSIFDVTGAASWCMWMYSHTNQSGKGLFTQNYTSYANYKWIGGYLTGNSASISGYVRIAGTAYSANNNVGVTGYYNNAWHHICTTFDRTLPNQRLKLYIDGTLRGAHDAADGNIETSNATAIGRWGSDSFDGLLDDVRIYNRAITPLEIAALYGGGCDAPTNIKGSIIYNDDDKVMQYCNGTEWVAMGPVGGTGGTGCTGPTGSAGDLMYNQDFAVLQYCNAEDWVAMGKTPADFIDIGLVNHWPLDETSGSSIASINGNGDTGTWIDNVNDDVTEEASLSPTITETAITFDGVDDHIVSDSPGNITYPTTFSAWIKTSTAHDGLIVSYERGNSSIGTFGIMINASGHARLKARDINLNGTSRIDTGAWTHIVGVMESGNTGRIYVNGVEENAGAIGAPVSGTGQHYIGVVNGSGAGLINFFNGSIDDARIYDRALTTEEVLTLYNATK